MRGRRRLGFEIKRTVAPRIRPSMRSALTELGRDHLFAIYAGDITFPLGENIVAVAASRVLNDLPSLR